MICPACSRTVSDGLSTCPYCGASLEAPRYPWETAAETVRKNEKNQKNRSRLVIALSSAIGAVLLILLTVFVIAPAVKNSPPKKPENTTASDLSVIAGSDDDTTNPAENGETDETDAPSVSETESTLPALSVLTVPAVGSVQMTVPAAGESEFKNDGAVFAYFSGEIYESGQEDSYSFTAEHTGEYRLQMQNLISGFTVSLYVYDADGSTVDYEYGVSNNGGLTAHLEGGKDYTAVVKSSSGTGTYELALGMQKAPCDISGHTAVLDATEFKGQKIDYIYVPEQTGTYRFWISQINSGKKVSMYVLDDAGYQIEYEYSLGINGGVTAVLTAGVPYTVRIQPSEDLGAFTMRIGAQMPTVDISGYTAVVDGTVFRGQKNNYLYTADLTGTYSFYITQINSGVKVSVDIYDAAEYRLAYTYSAGQGDGISASLEAGQTYLVQVGQSDETGAYTLSVGAQKPLQDATGFDLIADSTQFAKQTNAYRYKAPADGTFVFLMEQLPADVKVSVSVSDSAGYRLCSGSGLRGGAYVKASLKSGEVYEILVQQYYGFGDYTLRIEK